MSIQKNKIWILLWMAIGVFGFSQSDETHVSLEQQLPFKAGEWFEFRIHYVKIP